MMMKNWLKIRQSDSFTMENGTVIPVQEDATLLIAEVVESSTGSMFQVGCSILYAAGSSQDYPPEYGLHIIMEASVVEILPSKK